MESYFKKHVTFFATQGAEGASFIGRYLPLAKGLGKSKVRVDLLTLHHNYRSLCKKLKVYDVIKGVSVHYVGQMHVKKEGDKKVYMGPCSLFYVVLSSTIKMLLKGFFLKADIIVLCKPQPINSTAALLIKLIKQKKIILDCDDYELYANKLSNKLQKKVFQLFEDNVPKYCDLITVNTLFMKQRLVNLGIDKEKIIYIPNGVDLERFGRLDDNIINEIKSKLNLENKKIIGYIGALDLTGHSVDLLVKAFNVLYKTDKNIVLLIVGRGSDDDREFLKSLIKKDMTEGVKWVGFVDPDEVKYYYKLCSVIVDPVKSKPACEGRSPLKVFEGMASGVPIITGDLTDRKHILENGKYGLLVKLGDVEDLIRALKKILYDEEYSKNIASKSLERSKDFHWDTLNKKFISCVYAMG